MDNTFLGLIAAQLIALPKEELKYSIVVLPNKRAKLFLLEELKKQTSIPFFAPQIISIENLIESIAGIRNIDAVELLFEFYNVYLEITDKSSAQNFESFSNWAKIALQDFNEIDRYLLDSKDLFDYLYEIERIKHWTPNLENQTPLIQNQLAFWKMLPHYYEALHKHLIKKKIGYSGLIYRKAVQNCTAFIAKIETQKYIFVGFNALNKAEEILVQKLIETNHARIYWDIDKTFLEDDFHDAGYFIRNIQKKWPIYFKQPFNWVVDEFSKEKNIEIIGTPKSIGQAKIVGSIVENILKDTPNLDQTAIVLGEEKLVIPVLHALPKEVKSLNITMGYSSKNNPVQILIHKLFKLHCNAQMRNAKQSVFYYKELLEILNNPLLTPIVNGTKIIQAIHASNSTFITATKLEDWFNRFNGEVQQEIFELLFLNWTQSIEIILVKFQQILVLLKDSLSSANEQDKITLSFVFSVYTIIQKITNYYQKYQRIESLEALFSLYKQVIDQAQVSFEGEPLIGLQIMGILESRTLDFENVIITSLNEGKLPAGNTTQSFIPYDVKIEKGLPTYKEKDAIFTYHFYRLLQRAKNIYLLYNTYSEGLDAGEKSRFLTQLEIEKQPQHHLKTTYYNAYLPDKVTIPIEISKTEAIFQRLKEIATGKGFSPSSLTTYLRNPIQFYYQRILGIKEADEVEESIAVNTLGTIIHEVLEKMFQPFEGKNIQLQVADIDNMIQNIEAITQEKFIEVYKEGDIKRGKNLIAFEVAKRNVYNFLQQEKQNIESGDKLYILSLEKPHETLLEHPNLPFSVKIAGKVDRIELRNNTIRIIDYKTGKVVPNALKINAFDGLTLDLANDKIIQLLCYALMYSTNPILKGYPLQVGIISFKNMKSGFMPFGVGKGTLVENQITKETLSNFKEELVCLINQILNKELAFIEK